MARDSVNEKDLFLSVQDNNLFVRWWWRSCNSNPSFSFLFFWECWGSVATLYERILTLTFMLWSTSNKTELIFEKWDNHTIWWMPHKTNEQMLSLSIYHPHPHTAVLSIHPTPHWKTLDGTDYPLACSMLCVRGLNLHWSVSRRRRTPATTPYIDRLLLASTILR